MRRVRSTLKEGGFPILVVAAVNLFLVLCVCVLLPNHLVEYTVCPVCGALSDGGCLELVKDAKPTPVTGWTPKGTWCCAAASWKTARSS